MATNVDSSSLDGIDRAILRALQVNPRVAFSTLAAAVGISEQTAARRYRALTRSGVVRVVGVVNAERIGQTSWILRITCKPSGSRALARGLADRDDVGWVFVTGGGVEIICSVRFRSVADRNELVVHRLPRSAPVLGLSTGMYLHRFVEGHMNDWTGLAKELTADQEDVLLGQNPATDLSVFGDVLPLELDHVDLAIVTVLARDGRATNVDLAAAGGVTPGHAARRLQRLLQQRVVDIVPDIAPRAFGWPIQAQIWISTPPAKLTECGRALARTPDIPFAAAITGKYNLVAIAICRSQHRLFELITEDLGRIDGIDACEVVPITDVVKQSATLVEGDLLTR